MITESFLNTVLAKKYAQYGGEEENPYCKRVHDHPIATRVSIIAMAVFVSCFSAFIFVGTAFVSLKLICISGIFACTALKIADFILPYFAPYTRPASRTVFSKSSYEDYARLDFDGDLPTLTITTEDPKKAGIAHGYLLATQLYKIRKANRFGLHTLGGIPKPEQLKKTLKSIEEVIPGYIKQELQGVVFGYNKKRQDWKFFPGPSLTYEELLFLHILPEKRHFEYLELEKWVELEKNTKEAEVMGCTTIIDGNKASGPVFGRNLDWPSFGTMGTYTLKICRKTKGYYKTVEISCPGFVGGVLTGMNEEGLALGMNVCRGLTDQIKGLPAVIFNRLCLERCATFGEVKEFILDLRPLGPYHLTVADAIGDGGVIHFYQKEDCQDYIREWKGDRAVVTTNYRYGPNKGRSCPTMTNSKEREATLELYFDDLDQTEGVKESGDPKTWVGQALALPHVNNMRTIISAVFSPKTKEIQLSYDNGWGASHGKKRVDTKTWFK